MKFFASVLASMLALAGCARTANAPSPPKIDVEHVESVTVAVMGVTSDDDQTLCSGVWVGADRVLTARHCIDPEIGYVLVATRDEVFFDDYRARPSFNTHLSKLIADDPDHDLALLLVDSAPFHEVAVLAKEQVHAGDFVQAVGHSVGLWWSYSSGVVAAVRDINTGSSKGLHIQTTAPTSRGNSGGGLFNMRGELVGVAHCVLSQGQALNFYIAPIYIAALLERAH